MKSLQIMNSHLKITIHNYWPLYLLTIAAALVMRSFSRITDSDALTWILTPTTRWVSVLSGISFEYLPHTGYINHFHQFIIAPSCSGSRFMMILFLMLIFSFLHQMTSRGSGYCWFGFSVVFSYVFTIFVNGIRITVSIYLPDFLENMKLMSGWLTPDRLHTIIGTTVYFAALCLAYPLAGAVCRHAFLRTANECTLLLPAVAASSSTRFLKLFAPAFWYLLAVLAFPFLKRIYRNEWEGFAQYAELIIFICLTVLTLTCLVNILFAHISKHQK